MQKDQEQYKKTIIELKEKELRIFINSANIEWKLFHRKKEQKSEATKQSMDITDLEITSVLLCLNFFYCQANLKLINSLKFD